MTLDLQELAGMTSEMAATLREAGISNCDKLLEATAQPAARDDWAVRLGVDARTVLELTNRADLARIRGIGRVYSDLLEFAGVDTVMELCQRNPDHLYDKLVEVADKHHVKRTPSREEVNDWVAQAQGLDRSIYY